MRKAPIARVPPGPGQESVWDYPRPPRAEPSAERVVIELGGVTILDSTRSVRVLETSHPPVYYLPREDFAPGALIPVKGKSFCEFKGVASYLSVHGGDRTAERAAWYYPHPPGSLAILRDRVAVYPAAMDACTVDGEPVRAQEGGFYGGWITSRVVGPFKGSAGSTGW